MNTPTLPSALLLSLALLPLLAPSVALAGDLDGDGYDDLVVGARRLDHSNQVDAGAVAILAGSNQGLAGDQMIFQPAQAGERAGASVASGDFNCDGYLDLAFGAPLEDYVVGDSGSVYIYTNDQSGGYTSSWITRSDFGPEPQEEDHFGRALAVGDFDDDGCDDLAIGAPRASDGSTRSGLVYVGFGHEDGLVLDADGARNRPLGGSSFNNARYGFSLSAGDLDDDGVDDLIVGAPTYTQGGEQVGAVVSLYFAGGSDGFDPIAYTYGSATTCDDGSNDSTSPWFGWSTAIGDFDGDSVPELAVGAPGYQTPCYSGRVEVYSSSALNLSTTTLSEGSLNGRYGAALVAGDLDTDGDSELIVGASHATISGGPSASGAVFVHEGAGAGMGSASDTFTPVDFNQNAADQRFGSSLSLGYFSGGGLDLAVGSTRSKDQDNVRSGGVFTLTNTSGALSADPAMLSLGDLGLASQAGALFGNALSQ